MEEKYNEIMEAVIFTAKELKLPPEDLAICLIEGAGLNCPEIYMAIRQFTGD